MADDKRNQKSTAPICPKRWSLRDRMLSAQIEDLATAK